MLRYQDFSLGINKNPNTNFALDVSGNIQVSGNILPATNIESDLGSTTKRFRDIYLSGNSIDISGTLIQKEAGGGIKISDASGNTLDGKFNNIDISGNATINGNTTISGIINQVIRLDVSGSILPTRNLVYDLGAPDKRWNDLYLSGNTIDLSGTLLSRHTDGSLMVHDSNNNMVNLRANNIIAEGNLTVSGTTTTVNSTTVTVQDPIITLGSDVSNNKDKGIEFKYGTSKIGFFGYDDSTGNLTFLKDASNNSEVFTGTQGTIEGLAFKSTVASGTAPLTVASSTLVTNLNADLLDGLDSTKFMRTDVDTSTTGNIGIGTITPQAKLHINDTGAIIIPSGTTIQQPAIPITGMLRYNLTTNRLEFYSLYGWSSIGGISATGGNTVSDINGYRIHVFNSSSTFTVYTGGVIEYLAVAGGGGGGAMDGNGAGGGGGGAGGLIYNNAFTITSGIYTITIGGGGAAGIISPLSYSTNGNNTTAFGISCIGGGGGTNSSASNNGSNGGSGGGGGGSAATTGGTGGLGTTNQGNRGGNGGNTGSGAGYKGGGGGGAGVKGQDVADASSSTAGLNGGNGLSYIISGTNTYYAGGGGGGVIWSSWSNSMTGGTGGLGGGGKGGDAPTSQVATNGTAGTTNTGGGGGAGGYTRDGSAGGSGIVIIRYLL